jgi:hypothetical protein
MPARPRLEGVMHKYLLHTGLSMPPAVPRLPAPQDRALLLQRMDRRGTLQRLNEAL